jgi:hypothetical protein
MSGVRILSDVQLDRMADMRERGMSYGAIADWFTRNGTPVNHKTICWQCLRLGVLSPSGPHSNTGIKVPNSNGRPFTREEDRALLEMEAEGFTKAEMARKLGRPHNSVAGRLLTLARYAAMAEAA